MSNQTNINIMSIAKQVFNDEIIGITQVLDNLNDEFDQVVTLLLKCRGKVIVTGMGKSGHIGNKIAATLASTGTAAFFLHPAEALHGDLGMVSVDDIIIAISYSGESDELSGILPVLRRRKIPIIAITGGINSSLAKMSDLVLNIKISKEACPLDLAPTTSTTATLVMGDALAVSLLTLRGFKHEDFALSHPGGSLGRRLLTLVSDVMHTGVRIPVVNEIATLKDIVLEISQKSLGFTAVTDINNNLIGIITDGDLRRILDLSIDLTTVNAKSIIRSKPKVILETDLAVKALELMEEYKITGMLVVDHNNHLVGAFNMHDLFTAKLI